jgi:hypothetical protein
VQKPDAPDQERLFAAESGQMTGGWFVFAQAIVARAHPTDSAKRVRPHTLLSSLGNEISPLNHPYVSGGAGYKHLRGAPHNDQFKHWSDCVCVFVGAWMLGGACAAIVCEHRPTWRPKWTQRSNLAEQTAFARRQTPTHSPPLRLAADKDTRSPFATLSCALHTSLSRRRHGRSNFGVFRRN